MVKIKSNKYKPDQKTIEDVQKRIGLSLPEDYIQFLLEYNGGKPELNIINAEKISSVTINIFFGIDVEDDIIKQNVLYKDRLPTDCFVVGIAEGGNLICISTNKKKQGVYFWDHENEQNEGKYPDYSNMYFVTKSFSELLQGMSKFDASKIKVKKEDVISAWIDPEFLKGLQDSKK